MVGWKSEDSKNRRKNSYTNCKKINNINAEILETFFSKWNSKNLHYYWCNSVVNRSILICGNKMPTRCNRGFNCRSYCLLNTFRAPICPSSGAQEYYTVVAACGISCCGFEVAGLVWSWGLCVRFAGCCSILQTGHKTSVACSWHLFPHINDHARSKSPASILQTGHITLSSTPDQQLQNHSTKYHRQQPLYNTLELLMMGIVVPETCWASNKICNKNLCCI